MKAKHKPLNAIERELYRAVVALAAGNAQGDPPLRAASAVLRMRAAQEQTGPFDGRVEPSIEQTREMARDAMRSEEDRLAPIEGKAAAMEEMLERFIDAASRCYGGKTRAAKGLHKVSCAAQALLSESRGPVFYGRF